MEKKETALVRFFYVFSTIPTYRSSYTHKIILRVKVKSESHAQQRRCNTHTARLDPSCIPLFGGTP